MSSARDDSPSSTLRDGAPAPAPASPGRSASTVASSNDDEKLKANLDIDPLDEKAATQSNAMGKRPQGDYEERGIVEVEEDGQVRKAMVIVEEKSGKELLKDVAGGPYTKPQWRHSLPFMKPKYPPPPAPLSLDDAPVTPEVGADFLSFLFFNWISPMMALGSARTLQPSDMWKMDGDRSAGVLAQKLTEHYARRKQEAEEYNRRLVDPATPLPLSKRILYPLLPHREKREHDYRTKFGQKKPSLAWALSDTFGNWFWMAGLFKLVSDTATACSPLVLRAIIKWSTRYEFAMKGIGNYPSIGQGIGMSIGLFFMLIVASIGIHHFFYRSMVVGVLSRAALISAIYERALRFTQKSRGEIPNGKIVNHISTDTSRIDFASGFFHIVWTAPIQFIIIMIILIVQIGYSALPGIFFLLIMTPAQATIMKQLFAIRKKAMIWTDKRAKLLQEVLGGMRIVKLMSWEAPFLERLRAIRGMEIKYIRTLLIVRSAMMAFAMSLPVLATILALITYSATAHELQAATIFTVVTLFQLMRMPLMMWPMTLSAIADAANALGRLQVVFDAEVTTEERIIDPEMEEAVRIVHASFTWDAAPPVEEEVAKLEAKLAAAQAKKSGKEGTTGHATPAKTPVAKTPAKSGAGTPPSEAEANIFQIKDVNLSIPRGSLTAIVGAIGSGKSSLLQGLMGEMRRTDGKVMFSGSTSLCAQTPWIQNATVRENILFGLPFDEERYWAAIKNACLEPDLEILEDGDGTEIGEKGITLSGGQKQRVNIARALYFNADIIALDDPLSALDAGVGKAVFFNAIKGALAGKTRLLVTHAIHFLPHVDNVILLEDGRVAETGTYAELKARGGAFTRLVKEFGAEDEEEAEAGDEEIAIATSDPNVPAPAEVARSKMVTRGIRHQLMQEEERGTGAISGRTWIDYFKAGRGIYMVPFLLLAVAIAQGFTVITSYWLIWWQNYEWGWSNGKFMGVYAALGFGSAISAFFMGFSNAYINYFASVRLHADAIQRIMFAPQSFFDTTPLGRTPPSFSKDVDTIDNTLSDAMRMSVGTIGNIVGAIILLAIVSPWFLIAVSVVLVLYWHCAQFYRRSSREFKRIDALLRSSLYSHFSESLSGIATIRAYGESERFCADNIHRVDTENRAYTMTVINQRWLGIRLDMLGSLLTFSVALIVVLNHKVSAAKSGLGLSTMLSVQQAFSWLVRQLAEVENDMVGAERILHYANHLDQEAPQKIPSATPPPTWPAEGRIEFDNVYMKYRPELPNVLKGLSLSVKANEKIGVVGRTGAGKSSIMVTLFRLAEIGSGSIKIDDIDISTIGLNDLRSRISIIPQDPLLFSGTLRSNIDPFGTKTDAELYDALKRAHLIPSATYGSGEPGTETPTSRFNLDYAVEEEGNNLSVGERSLVSLARALVRDPKILVLDEATASVDVETDAKIQETIRREFGNKTLLCIAHRLRTILSYDRILVMSDGQAEAFDTPENLYTSGSHFREMCDKSGITLEDIRHHASLKFGVRE
ncbi:hypothetical protein VHUM_00167 [Vanrija humicola]|uniref:ABC transporter n=1 Tax=Vanrija humicola TaxID=5417 RepID=A0A7D8Z7D3_VANHU|nr:hypothetical protein VHUM_00167 [Vanrija humicola]